ncbi:hypothetical protein [Alteromonas macleodii]|jgi:quercetin dioxygenase-like cupin family protein|uniref:hypothetical protein n=1 Tax=Alteromonas macleodii TaxID=28108 RepID=UPI002FE1D132
MKKVANFVAALLATGAMLSGFAMANDDNTGHAHIVSPKHYTLLLENENVLVLKMTLQPGEEDTWHKHNAETVYFEDGGKAIIKTADKAMTLEIPDGYVMWHDEWEHQVKNIGDSTITAIIVEAK